MVSNVTNTTQASHAYQLQQQHNTQTHKNAQNDKEPQDSVVLSKKATESRDLDHDGDRY